MATFFIYAVLLLLPMMLVVLRRYSSTPPSTTKNPPPSPPKWPIIGHLHHLSPLVHRSFLTLSQRYGRDGLMLLHLGSVPSLVVTTTEAAREILQTQDLIFADRPTTEPLRKLSFNYKEVGMAPYGDYWREGKKLLVLHCLSLKQVQSYSGIRDEEVAITLKEIAKLSAGNKIVNLSDVSVQHSNNISTRVTFGRKYNEAVSENKFGRVMDDYSDALRVFYFEDTIPALWWIDRLVGSTRKLDATLKSLDSFLEQTLEDRLAKLKTSHNEVAEGEPLIDVMLLNKKNDDIRITLDRPTMKAILMDMYVAGTQTTSALLEWTLAELLANPDVRKKLTTEIRSIVKNKQHITTDELDQMEYLKAAVMESARLNPPGPVLSTRLATQDANVMGYDIAKGTRVYINAWAIGRDPKLWDRPNDFMPERFLGDSISFLKHDFKLLTFGAGRRGCSGKTFALAIIEHFIANLLCNFDLVLPDGVTKDDIDLTESTGLSNRPKFPLLALAKPCR